MKSNKRVGLALAAATACAGFGSAGILSAGPALASASVAVGASRINSVPEVTDGLRTPANAGTRSNQVRGARDRGANVRPVGL